MNVFSDIVINKYLRGYFMKKINELNVEELRQLKNIVLQYSTLDELVTAIDFSLNAIYYQDVPLNVRFDLNMFKELSIFTDNELKILSLHHIYNLQDLCLLEILHHRGQILNMQANRILFRPTIQNLQ